MFKKIKIITFIIAAIVFISGSVSSYAAISEKAKDDKTMKQDKTQRASKGLFDLQRNTVSNIDFFVTNYGIFGFNTTAGGGVGGGYWPRNSLNQYIFGGGVWFGALKKVKQDTVPLVILTYNPNSGLSWMAPGRINEGGPLSTTTEDTYSADPNNTTKYRSYFSTDFNVGSGEPYTLSDGPNWPIWDTSLNPEDTLKVNRYFGQYVDHENTRNSFYYPKGPAFISQEDIFATYKDTDLNYYEGGAESRRTEGYPLELQFEEMIYSWGFGKYKDFIFIKYEITNYSNDTLLNCWVAPVLDVDLARAPNTRLGAGNDRTRYYHQDSSLNLAYQWTNGDFGEAGQGFGYLGFDFLESPAVFQAIDEDGLPTFDPENGYLRRDKKFFDNEEQLGLVSMRNWNIQEDPSENADRYTFISEVRLDDDNGPGDKRFMMSTGPFNMRPADTIRVVVGIILANAAKGGDADGTEEDVQELISLNKFAQAVYDNNFRSPIPPDRTRFTEWIPMNNAIQVSWDATSELSDDKDEKGLDFLGYRLYRARRFDLDTFDLNTVAGGGDYPSGKGPLGWKQIASWELPAPFRKSVRRIINEPNNQDYSFIDSLVIVGPYTDKTTGQVIDDMAIRCWRIPRGVSIGYTYINQQRDTVTTSNPFINDIDSSYFSKPWGSFYSNIALSSDINTDEGIYFYENIKNTRFNNEILETVVFLNRSINKYNPLLFEPILTPINLNYLNEKLSYSFFSDGIVGDTTIKILYNDEGDILSIDTLRTSIDTVYFRNTLRRENINGTNTWLIEALIPKAINTIMSDTSTKQRNYVKSVLDSIYQYAQAGSLTVQYNDFVSDSIVKHDVILPFMKEITNNRTFYDVGDDNNNQLLEASDDPTRTEKLINNMDYYYRMLAYDEGDWASNTEKKINSGILKERESSTDSIYFNIIKTTPKAVNLGSSSDFEIISVDSSKIGGLYNFNFFSLDPGRLKQEFGGHELELEFQPYWEATTIALSTDENDPPLTFGLYRSLLTMKDVTTGDLLFENTLYYEPQACNFRYTELFSENGASVVFTYPGILRIDTLTTPPDTITFQNYNNEEIYVRSGQFTTGDFTQQGYCYSSSMLPPAYGTLGFGFNFTFEQHGGAFRQSIDFDSFKTPGEDAVTHIDIINDKFLGGEYAASTLPDLKDTRLTQFTGIDWDLRRPMFGSFNNGPGEYLVEFLPGGQESVTFEFTDGTTKQFNVPYLNVKVTNVKEYKRPEPGGDSVAVKYPDEMPHMDLAPVNATIDFAEYGLINLDRNISTAIYGAPYPDPINLAFENNEPALGFQNWIGKTIGMTNLGPKEYKSRSNEFIGKYNLHSYGFLNSRRLQVFNFTNRYVIDVNSPYKDIETSYSGLPQNRYYLTTINGSDTIDFVNVINIGGLSYAFNYANAYNLNRTEITLKGVSRENQPRLNNVKGYVYGPDFTAGDKVTLKSQGGVAGLPLPGAKVKVRVKDDKVETANYTDDDMDDILVVPNPYYISHQGERSPYDSKLYFTKLPPRCTISIYTVAGDLVKVIEHDEFTAPEPERAYIEVWNLLTDNNQRAQSQALVAHIKTPDGAETIKPFSIIVGGFRIISD